MSKSARSKAEAKFNSARKQENQVLKEMQDAQRARAEQTAKLRALRLARDAEEREAAGKAPDGGEDPPRLPQAHRRQT